MDLVANGIGRLSVVDGPPAVLDSGLVRCLEEAGAESEAMGWHVRIIDRRE